MAAIRWVCVSDLHLGALNSVLSPVSADGERIDGDHLSPAMEALCAALRALPGTDEPPELVVLGDLFELALSSTDDAGRTFGQLVRGLGIGTPEAAVAPAIRFVPGNHDHHLWTRARGQSYLDHIATLPADQPLPTEPHASHLLPAHDPFPVRDRMVELLVARNGGGTVQVVQSYPNLGLADRSGRRAVVLSHGHFIEPLYRSMSLLDEVFSGPRSGLGPVEDLEAENGGWIDFFWSSMGDSGQIGRWSRDLYESLQEDGAIDREVAAIGRLLTGRSDSRLRRHLEGFFAENVLAEAVKRSLRRERHHPDLLSPRARQGLADYLAGPVAGQVAAEIGRPSELTFVFGHTHKPFAEQHRVPGLPDPLAVHNTGGWVSDTVAPEPHKGAVVVLIDEDLNVAPLRVFAPAMSGATVTVGDGTSSNPLVDRLGALVDPDRDPWRALADATRTTALERCRQLAERVQAETGHLGLRRPDPDSAGPAGPPAPSP